jgi:hypothetical protein
MLNSNHSYFASKTCTYTDASGRPVPAPRHFKIDRPNPPPDSRLPSSPYNNQFPDRFTQPTHGPPVPNSYPTAGSSLKSPLEHTVDHDSSRKRFRSVHGKPLLPSEAAQLEPPPAPATSPIDRPIGLDHALTRELVNRAHLLFSAIISLSSCPISQVFFTHCHPIRIILHKPSFSAALSHNRVPLHLLHAVCALAAPLSKQSRIRTTPSRYAGKPFAQEAITKIFDSYGRLVCEPNLATAQALCLLQIHDVMFKLSYSARYHGMSSTSH